MKKDNEDILIKELLANYKGPEDLIGENGRLKRLTKKLGGTRDCHVSRFASVTAAPPGATCPPWTDALEDALFTTLLDDGYQRWQGGIVPEWSSAHAPPGYGRTDCRARHRISTTWLWLGVGAK